jgi:tetratricopeptide (TPR) repeat protein
LKKLGTCYFRLGNFAAADSVYDLLLELGDDSPEILFMKGEVNLARGDFDRALSFFDQSYKKGFATGRLRMISMLRDRGESDSAYVLLESMDENAARLLDYSIERAGMKIVRGENADSLLNSAIQVAITSSRRNPDDPRPNLILGKAYRMLEDYEKSIYYLNMAHFLEDSPFEQSFILLEMGRTEDLLGERDRAKSRYRQVIELDGGQYQSMLAKKYLNSPYKIKQ